MTPEQVRRLVATAELALLLAIARRVAAARGRPVAVYGLAVRTVSRLLPDLRRLVRRAIGDAWQAGEDAADRELRPDTIGAQVTPSEVERRRAARVPQVHASQRRLAAQAEHDLTVALGAVPDRTARTWRRAQLDARFRLITRTRLPEAKVAALEAMTGHIDGRPATRLLASRKALDQLREAGVVTFEDSRGRRWDLASYAEMAVRTATRHATVNATLDRLADHGIDLVMVPDVPGECALCRPFEGKVFSISGTDPDRPSLASAVARGLYHPNCRHHAIAYRPGVTPLPRATADPEGDRARQRTRALERQVREWRRREVLARELPLDDTELPRVRQHLRAALARLHAHVEATSPKTRRYSDQRTRIGGAR